MPKIIDLTNQRFGKLVVIHKDLSSIGTGRSKWICQCECGNTTSVFLVNLTNEKTQGCGCSQKEAMSKAMTTHGLSGIDEYSIWCGMITRCYNEKSEVYGDYGGRGITVSDEWRSSPEAFYKDMGSRPSSMHTVDRRDNDKGYCKDNCRWATKVVQANNRRNNIRYEYRGDIKTLGEWSRELDLNYKLVYYRIKNLGWTFEEAIQPIECLKITFEGEIKILHEWCDLLNLPEGKTYLRILRGESFEKIVYE